MNTLTLKKITLAASAAFLSCTSAWADIVPVTVVENVNMSHRSVSLMNQELNKLESITMWTFSHGSSWGWSGGNGGTADNAAPFPGPVLVFREKDSVEYTFRDTCPCEGRSSSHPYAGHTIHLHGLDVATLDDGVHDTSFSVLPGQSYTYKMQTREAGSFVYHCHIHTVLHQQMGMYGGIIVMPADSTHQNLPFSPVAAYNDAVPSFNRQYFWVLSEVDKAWHDKAASGNFGDSTEFAYFTQYNPKHFFLANYHIDVSTLKTSDGKYAGRGIVKSPKDGLAGKAGDTLLIRLGNLGYWNKRVTLGGLSFDIVSTDGKPLRNANHAYSPKKNQTSIEAAPGERFDLMVKLPAVTTNTSYTAKIEFLNPHNKTVGVNGKAFVTQKINSCVNAPASANAC